MQLLITVRCCLLLLFPLLLAAQAFSVMMIAYLDIYTVYSLFHTSILSNDINSWLLEIDMQTKLSPFFFHPKASKMSVVYHSDFSMVVE